MSGGQRRPTVVEPIGCRSWNRHLPDDRIRRYRSDPSSLLVICLAASAVTAASHDTPTLQRAQAPPDNWKPDWPPFGGRILLHSTQDRNLEDCRMGVDRKTPCRRTTPPATRTWPGRRKADGPLSPRLAPEAERRESRPPTGRILRGRVILRRFDFLPTRASVYRGKAPRPHADLARQGAGCSQGAAKASHRRLLAWVVVGVTAAGIPVYYPRAAQLVAALRCIP
jgi:hypothetical protein